MRRLGALVGVTLALLVVGGAAAQATVPTPRTSPGAAAPTLGVSTGPPTEGFGTVKPRTVSYGGDETSVISRVRWSSWGGSQAVGQGRADWVWPGLCVACGSQYLPATVVAYRLGSCRGHPAYTRLEWFFPSRGQAFDASKGENVCSFQTPGDPAAPANCGRAALRSPPGLATDVSADGVGCPAARAVVAASPARRYVPNGGRFRVGKWYCGAEKGLVPMLFSCGYGWAELDFDVT